MKKDGIQTRKRKPKTQSTKGKSPTKDLSLQQEHHHLTQQHQTLLENQQNHHQHQTLHDNPQNHHQHQNHQTNHQPMTSMSSSNQGLLDLSLTRGDNSSGNVSIFA